MSVRIKLVCLSFLLALYFQRLESIQKLKLIPLDFLKKNFLKNTRSSLPNYRKREFKFGSSKYYTP